MITIGSRGNSSLGDCLYLTSVFRYKTGKVILHNDEQSKQVGSIFHGICDVEHNDLPPERPDNIIKDIPNEFYSVHRTRKILLSLGINEKISSPFVKISKEELDWAIDFLKDYKNPIVIVNDNSGSCDKTNTRANYVRPPVDIMQSICNKIIKEGFTPLQFGRKENERFTPLIGAMPIRGLSIRKLAACYSIVKKYIGGDTGDYHLMIATGGKANVFIPNETFNLGYIYNDLLYKKENFLNQDTLVKYIKFHE